MTNAVKIHSFPLSGHSHRVILLVSLAGIEYEVNNVDLPNGEHKQKPYLDLNPLGEVPTIEDGETIIYDSNAILVYLARKYAPRFLPTDPKQEAEVHRFLALAAGEISFGPAAARLVTVFNAQRDPDFCQEMATKALTKLENHLQGREFLVGNSVTIADVAIYSYTAHAPEGNISLDDYPNVRRLLKNIEALDGFVPMPKTKAGLCA